MRTHIVHRRLAQAAVVAASAALLAACGSASGTQTAETTPPPAETIRFAAGVPLVSDGTTVVRVGDQKVTFPTTVTEAVFSPDGSRIAFVDGDGNVATARPDGKSVKVLTTKAAGVVRSRPTWMDGEIVFAERSGSATAVLKAVYSNGSGPHDQEFGEHGVQLGATAGGGAADPKGSAASVFSGAGFDPTIAFQRPGPKGAEVWIVDLNQRSPLQSKVADGSEPALSPDGRRIAFVDPTGQIEVLDRTATGAKAVKVSFGASAPTHLVWTADGRIAYSTPTGVESIAATVAAGATTNPATPMSSAPGTATFLPATRDTVSRITGADPVALGIAASQAIWPTYGTATAPRGYLIIPGTVILTGTSNLQTVLAGSPLTQAGPVVFTTGSTLDSRSAAEMKRLLGPPEQHPSYLPIKIVGGTDVVPAQVESAMRALGYSTVRTAAADPIAMAATVAGNPQENDNIFLVDVADIAGYASVVSVGGTVLLTNGSAMPDRVKAYLNGINPSATIYPLDPAAQAAMSSSWPGKPGARITTLTSDATAALLNKFWDHAKGVVVVDRSNLADVMTAVSLARTVGAPVLAIDPTAGLEDAIKAWLDGSSAVIDRTFIVDSKGVIGADLERTLGGLVAGPLGAATVTNPKAIA